VPTALVARPSGNGPSTLGAVQLLYAGLTIRDFTSEPEKKAARGSKLWRENRRCDGGNVGLENVVVDDVGESLQTEFWMSRFTAQESGCGRNEEARTCSNLMPSRRNHSTAGPSNN
jgi:hypothetical protein